MYYTRNNGPLSVSSCCFNAALLFTINNSDFYHFFLRDWWLPIHRSHAQTIAGAIRDTNRMSRIDVLTIYYDVIYRLYLKEVGILTQTRPRGYKTFFMLNSAEHEI